MKKLAELKKKLTDLKAEGTKLLDLAAAEDRLLADDESARADAIQAEVKAAEAEIAGLERQAEMRRQMAPAAGQNTVRDANPATTHGFNDLAEFAVAVRGGGRPGGAIDSRLMAAPPSPHTGGAASGEGYEVPPEFSDDIWEVVSEVDDFGPLVDEEPTMHRQVQSRADETTPWGSSGVQARWRSEGSQMTADKLKEEPRMIHLHELYVFVTASEELLEDAPRLAARLTRKSGEAIAWKKNDALVNGSGVGQPLGWMNSGALVSVAKEGGQTADTIKVDNLTKMYSRLMVVPGDKAIWLANSDIFPQLVNLIIGDTPVWTPPNGLVGAPNGFVLGYPLRFTEHARTLGDKGDIQLTSLKGYHSLRREAGPKFARSMHLYFDYATEAFRWTFRFGGQPHLSAPVSPANGAATKSHFITLDERA